MKHRVVLDIESTQEFSAIGAAIMQAIAKLDEKSVTTIHNINAYGPTTRRTLLEQDIEK